METKTLSLLLVLVLVFCIGTMGEVRCGTCSGSYSAAKYTTVYGQGSRKTCRWTWSGWRCSTQYYKTSSRQLRAMTVTSMYQCCSTVTDAIQPTTTSTSSDTATRTPQVKSLSRTVDSVATNLSTVLPSMSPTPPALNDSIVQIAGLDAGGIAGTVVFVVVLIVVLVAMIVVVVFGVYKYRTRSNKSSVDTDTSASTYNSTPGDIGRTIRLEDRGLASSNPLYEMCLEDHGPVSPNSMYETVDIPNRNAYEEVSNFETFKAVPNGNADVAFYSYVPSTVARVNMQSRSATAASQNQSTDWTEPGNYASLQSSFQQGDASAHENVQYSPPAETAVQLYDDLSRMKCIEIPRQTLRNGPVLGSGEFGVVHKGQWSTPEGLVAVALKVSHRDAPEVEKVKLLQEVAIMKQFVHPNVVRLLGAVTVKEPLILVMELLSGGDLRDLLTGLQRDHARKVDENTPSLLLKFCGQIAEGMKYLSRKGFIHRDLAARNILLDCKQSCKISDFGLSRGLDENAYYMASGGKIPFRCTAPEALLYKKYSTHSDVWSYGMLLYEIWSLGEPPYKDLSVRQVIEAMNEGRYDIIMQSPPPGCPRAIYFIMVDCWNLEYHSRPDFATIVDLLSVPSSLAVLDIPQESLSCVANPQLAAQLGAPMSSASDLYMDLQRKYGH